jgi:anti-anti-sigma regulatory factor
MSKSATRTNECGLGYYIHDGPTAFHLQLSGSLSGDGIPDLEQTWRTASSTFGGRRLAIDLSSVTGMDCAGSKLLNRWQVEGACIVVNSSAAKVRIQSMTDLPVTLLETNPKPFNWPPVRVAPRWVAAFLVLLYPAAGGTVGRHGINPGATSTSCAEAPTPAHSHEQSVNHRH